MAQRSSGGHLGLCSLQIGCIGEVVLEPWRVLEVPP